MKTIDFLNFVTSFCEYYNLKSIIKQRTCFKNVEKPSCVDLILTNRPKSFQSTCAIETGLSDFHRMTVSVLKMHFRKLPPKHLLNNPDCFYKVYAEVLNPHAPQKKKFVWWNNKPFMNKTLSKANIIKFYTQNKETGVYGSSERKRRNILPILMKRIS